MVVLSPNVGQLHDGCEVCSLDRSTLLDFHSPRTAASIPTILALLAQPALKYWTLVNSVHISVSAELSIRNCSAIHSTGDQVQGFKFSLQWLPTLTKISVLTSVQVFTSGFSQLLHDEIVRGVH